MKRSMLAVFHIICFGIIVWVFPGCGSGSQKEGVPFSYAQILKKEFKYDAGKAVPVTIEQAIEMDGYFDDQGVYFLFTSNREQGNYDIYIRELSGIHTVRLTTHPSRDTSPAISPGGDQMAFVSHRDDPEGDIFTMPLDLAAVLEKDKISVETAVSKKDPARNLTREAEPVTKTVRLVKDASPCWSPGGEYIAYSSDKDGLENIWIMTRDGKDKKQLTDKGGMYPRFSRDGSYIVFVSYRNEKNRGDVYQVNIQTGEEKQLVSSDAIELYPSFMGNNNELIFTRIDRDTNGDSKIDLNDNSVLYYKNLQTGQEFPLTLYSSSSFDAHWSAYNEGVLIYSEHVNNNLNINVIPDTGIIPKRDNARSQYNLAGKYLKEYQDEERYMAGLERVYDFHHEKRDVQSIIYVTSALQDLATGYHSRGRTDDRDETVLKLQKMSTEELDFPGIINRYLQLKFKNKNTTSFLQGIIKNLATKKTNQPVVPYLMEELGNSYLEQGKNKKALNTYNKMVEKYSSYNRLMYVYYSMATIQMPGMLIEDSLPEEMIKVIESRYVYLKNDAITFLVNSLNDISGKRDMTRLSVTLLDKYGSTESLKPVLQYYLGKTYYDAGKLSLAEKYGEDALSDVKKNDQVFYRSHVLLGSIARSRKNLQKMEHHYAEAANNYILLWQQPDFRMVVKKLIDYYEEYGGRSELAGKHGEAVKLYKKYVSLLTRLHLLKKFEDIYNEYGARAHILYIDAFVQSGDDVIKSLDELIEEYIGPRQQSLNVARMDFKKAYLYGLGYIYAKKAVAVGGRKTTPLEMMNTRGETLEGQLTLFKKAINQVEWALFIDDTFIAPFILKGWIYQYVDMLRKIEDDDHNGRYTRLFKTYFPDYLWERSIPMYEKALETNDETVKPGQEGDLHLNLANVYFLLNNYPRALIHYKKVREYKDRFESPIQEAMYHYHSGYCYWQNGNLHSARQEFKTTLLIYKNLSGGRDSRRYSSHVYNIYRYFALFDMNEENYEQAIEWFQRILNYAEKNNIQVDRARYMQNIALCLNKLGRSSEALSYLNSTEKLLREYPEDARSYKLMWQFFGIVPLKFYDLGLDVAVIGESKIFEELDTYTKKLLTISMKEDIHFNSGKYSRAIRHLKRKLKLLGEQDNTITRESTIKVLNNIGYNYFFAGDYENAEKYFEKAWEYADDAGMASLTGKYEIMVNISFMYSYLLENKPDYISEPDVRLNHLVDRIRKYREDYSTMRYRVELKELEKKASASEREVTEIEKKNLKDRIEKETSRQYYRIDVLLGILKYYRAELFFNREVEKKNGVVDHAYAIYESNRLLYDQYIESMNDISQALENMPDASSRRLEIKLLLNRARCYSRTGFYQKAYEDYFSAEKLAEQYEYNDLRWQVYGHTAEFLAWHGAGLEIRDHKNRAKDYFNRSISLVEEEPLRYAARREKVLGIYRGYIDLLLAEKSRGPAFRIAERMTSFNRIILIASESPDLSIDQHDQLYRRYRYLLNNHVRMQNELSSKLEKGASSSSKNINSLRSSMEKIKNQMHDLLSTAEKSSTLLHSYLTVNQDSSFEDMPEGMTVFRFYLHDGKKGYWKITGDSIGFEYMKSPVNEFIDKTFSNNTRNVIIASKDYQRIFSNENIAAMGTRGRFIPSLDRIHAYLDHEEYPLTFITSDKGALTQKLKKHISFQTFDRDGDDPGRYNLVIDSGPSGFNLDPGYLFRQQYLYPTVIKNVEGMDYETFMMLMESSLYARVKQLIITVDASDTAIIDLTRNIAGEHKERDTRKEITGEQVLVTGLEPGIPGYKPADKGAAGKKNEWAAYERSLKQQKHDAARNHLHRWLAIAFEENDSRSTYHFQLSKINLNEGKYNAALNEIDRVLKRTQDKDIVQKAKAYKIYLLLYSGEIQKARNLYSSWKEDPGVQSSHDARAFGYILEITNSGKAGTAFPGDDTAAANLLNPDMLKLLAAQYLSLYGYTGEARGLVNTWSPSYTLPVREHVRAYLLGYENTQRLDSAAAFQLVSLSSKNVDIEKIEQRLRNLLTGEKHHSGEGILLLEIMHKIYAERGMPERSDSVLSSFDLTSILSGAAWMDKAFYLGKMTKTMSTLGEYQKAHDYVNLWGKAAGESAPLTLTYLNRFNEAKILAKKKNYSGSHDLCRQLLNNMPDDFPMYPEVQLLQLENEVNAGKLKDAKKRWSEISPYITPGIDYIYRLLMVRIRFLEILKAGTVSDSELENIEKMVHEALGSLDKNRSEVSYPLQMDIVKSSLNAVMSFRMSRGYHVKALYYAEVIKLLELRSALSLDHNSNRLNDEIIKQYRSIQEESRAEEFIALLEKYPSLNYAAIAGMLPLKKYQSSIPEKTVVIYMVRNHRDIYYWVMGRRFVEPGRIKDGFVRLEDWLREYRDAVSLLKPVSGYSSKLKSLFSPLAKNLKQQDRLLFVVDSDLDPVPFEIMGERDMLEETHSVFYSGPILSSLVPSRGTFNEIGLAGDPDTSLATSLQYIAVKESGIQYNKTGMQPGKAIHLFTPLRYDPVNRTLMINQQRCTESLRETPFLYISSPFSAGLNLDNVLITLTGINRCGAVIIDEADMKDVNTGIFADRFYSYINDGKSITSAFILARRAIIDDDRYKHPSFWAGLRLYIQPADITRKNMKR